MQKLALTMHRSVLVKEVYPRRLLLRMALGVMRGCLGLGDRNGAFYLHELFTLNNFPHERGGSSFLPHNAHTSPHSRRLRLARTLNHRASSRAAVRRRCRTCRRASHLGG